LSFCLFWGVFFRDVFISVSPLSLMSCHSDIYHLLCSHVIPCPSYIFCSVPTSFPLPVMVSAVSIYIYNLCIYTHIYIYIFIYIFIYLGYIHRG
jgi:hypothetical protein